MFRIIEPEEMVAARGLALTDRQSVSADKARTPLANSNAAATTVRILKKRNVKWKRVFMFFFGFVFLFAAAVRLAVSHREVSALASDPYEKI